MTWKYTIKYRRQQSILNYLFRFECTRYGFHLPEWIISGKPFNTAAFMFLCFTYTCDFSRGIRIYNKINIGIAYGKY